MHIIFGQFSGKLVEVDVSRHFNASSPVFAARVEFYLVPGSQLKVFCQYIYFFKFEQNR